jgi:hypothetical protein
MDFLLVLVGFSLYIFISYLISNKYAKNKKELYFIWSLFFVLWILAPFYIISKLLDFIIDIIILFRK